MTVDEEYARRFGDGDELMDGNREDGDKEGGEDEDNTDKEGQAGPRDGGGEVGKAMEKSNAGTGEFEARGPAIEDEDEPAPFKANTVNPKGSKGKRLARHVHVAKDLFEKEPEEVKDRIRKEMEEDFQQRMAAHRGRLGEALADASLVQRLASVFFL